MKTAVIDPWCVFEGDLYSGVVAWRNGVRAPFKLGNGWDVLLRRIRRGQEPSFQKSNESGLGNTALS